MLDANTSLAWQNTATNPPQRAWDCDNQAREGRTKGNEKGMNTSGGKLIDFKTFARGFWVCELASRALPPLTPPAFLNF